MQTQRSTTEISHRPVFNFESTGPTIDPPDGQGGSGGAGTPTTPPPEEEEEETPNP